MVSDLALHILDKRRPPSTPFAVALGCLSNLPCGYANPIAVASTIDGIADQAKLASDYGWLFFAIDLLKTYRRILFVNTTTDRVHHVDCGHVRSSRCVRLREEHFSRELRYCKKCLPSMWLADKACEQIGK